MANVPRFRRNPAIGSTVIDDETFLIEPESQEVFYLDAVSSALWRLLEEPRTAEEMAELFAAAFPDRPAEEISRDIAAATADLLARGLAFISPTREIHD